MSTSGARYLAVAIATRDEASGARLRAVVTAKAPPAARVMRRRQGVVVALCEVNGGVDRRALADELRRETAAQLADASVSVGVAGPKPSSAGAHLAMLQAEQALVVGRALQGDGHTIAFEDLGPYCFVLGQPAADIRAFSERILGPLADGDRHVDLVHTLESYIRNHGSLNAVARELYLHRNTVRQRLRRIARLTGADLNDADARLALQLALLGRSALERLAS